MNRKQFNDVLIAGNGSGKTTLMLKIAYNYLKYNEDKRILFLISDDGEEALWNFDEIELNELGTFTGVKKLIIDKEKDFDYIRNFYSPYTDKDGEKKVRRFNGLMCCDDLGVIMGRRPENIIRFLKRRRQPNIDFLWSFHGLRTDVPPSFYTYVNRIYLGRTSDNHEHTMQELPHDKRELFEKIYFETQKITETKPHYFSQITINPLSI